MRADQHLQSRIENRLTGTAACTTVTTDVRKQHPRAREQVEWLPFSDPSPRLGPRTLPHDKAGGVVAAQVAQAPQHRVDARAQLQPGKRRLHLEHLVVRDGPAHVHRKHLRPRSTASAPQGFKHQIFQKTHHPYAGNSQCCLAACATPALLAGRYCKLPVGARCRI